MTGFGQATITVDDVSYSLEIKSLNGKFLKSVIKLPDIFSIYEPRVEQILRDRLIRGSVTYSLRLRDISEQAAWPVNPGAVRGYVKALQEIIASMPKAAADLKIDLASMLELPGVCQMPELSIDEQQKRWQTVETLTHQAIDSLIAMRDKEGEMLRADLEKHCAAIHVSLAQVIERAPNVVTEYAAKLRQRVQVLLSAVELQLREDDLSRDISIFAERSDINEEISRLQSHLQQFAATMASKDDNTGRKLEFLAQEMLRETNTIGSKANDSLVAQRVVEIKGHIDRIKEQTLNVV